MLKFNAIRSTCFKICLYSKRENAEVNSDICSFSFGENVIEEVDKWTHLGHMINNKITGFDATSSRRNDMVRRIKIFHVASTHQIC